jgi:hypothetical protein
MSPDEKLLSIEALLKERQRAFIEMVTTAETLRMKVARLEEILDERDRELAKLRIAPRRLALQRLRRREHLAARVERLHRDVLALAGSWIAVSKPDFAPPARRSRSSLASPSAPASAARPSRRSS